MDFLLTNSPDKSIFMLSSMMLRLEHMLLAQNRIMDILPVENALRDERINRQMTFLDINALLRTDIDFINKSQPEHHLQDISSPFELISVSMISNFPVDYMHNSCLGINKQLLKLWIDGSKISRVAQVYLNSLSDTLKTVSKCIPIEFARKSFELDDFQR